MKGQGRRQWEVKERQWKVKERQGEVKERQWEVKERQGKRQRQVNNGRWWKGGGRPRKCRFAPNFFEVPPKSWHRIPFLI